MVDTRIYERLARELIQFNSTLKFRFLLKNGRVIERVISEVTHTSDADIIFSYLILSIYMSPFIL